MKRGLLLFISAFLFSCQERGGETIVATKEKENVGEYVCDLKENIGVIGNVKDFSFYDDSSFFVLSDNNIIEYTIKGEQKNIFSKLGQGPGEYVSPTLINIHDAFIYVWCASTLKLIKYSKEGKYIEEITNYRKAIKNFKFLDENILCFYKSDGKIDAIIDIYSIAENKVIKSVGDELTEEDLLLLSVASKPNMIVDGESLYFTKPSELSIYKLDLKSFALNRKIYFKDSEFVVEKVQDARSMFNSDIQGVLTYMAKNSIVDNLLKVGDNFYIKSEVGKYAMDFQNKKMDSKQRSDKYYLYDYRFPNTKNIQAIKVSKKGGTHRYALFGNDTYFLQEDGSSENEQDRIKMYKLKI